FVNVPKPWLQQALLGSSFWLRRWQTSTFQSRRWPQRRSKVERMMDSPCSSGTFQNCLVRSELGHLRPSYFPSSWRPIPIFFWPKQRVMSLCHAVMHDLGGKYKVDAVCSNVLQTIRDWVTIVEADEASSIEVPTEITGDEKEPLKVFGVLSRSIERRDAKSVDVPLVQAMIEMHRAKIRRSTSGYTA
ncbi:Phosphopantothenate--cysteine ligase 1, partial [Durusdinium trenchii]